jgi:hemoglobin-like flavoprotein
MIIDDSKVIELISTLQTAQTQTLRLMVNSFEDYPQLKQVFRLTDDVQESLSEALDNQLISDADMVNLVSKVRQMSEVEVVRHYSTVD